MSLQDLIKHTPENSADHSNLSESLALMQEFLNVYNLEHRYAWYRLTRIGQQKIKRQTLKFKTGKDGHANLALSNRYLKLSHNYHCGEHWTVNYTGFQSFTNTSLIQQTLFNLDRLVVINQQCPNFSTNILKIQKGQYCISLLGLYIYFQFIVLSLKIPNFREISQKFITRSNRIHFFSYFFTSINLFC